MTWSVSERRLLQRPLRFAPLFQDRVWGGRRLASRFADAPPAARIAEAWLLSGHPKGLTPVAEGPLSGQRLPELMARFGPLLVGARNGQALAHGRFPLLIKLLDVDDWLSVQVHPTTGSRALAAEVYGKTELWVALWAAADAHLLLGLKDGCTRADLEQAGPSAALVERLQKRKVQPGQSFFVPSGTVHALGPGLTLLEVQECSDATYRLYDWDRPRAAARPLHWEQGLRALETPAPPANPAAGVPAAWNGIPGQTLADCPAFRAVRLALAPGSAYACQASGQTFDVLMGWTGAFGVTARGGAVSASNPDCLLIPAAMGSFTIRTDAGCEILAIRGPRSG